MLHKKSLEVIKVILSLTFLIQDAFKNKVILELTECQILKAFSWLAKTSLHFLKPLLYLQYYLNCKGRLKAMITQSKIDNASQIKRYDSLILQKTKSSMFSDR